MDEASLMEILSGRRRDVGARLLRAGLSVASWGYAAATTCRNAAYDRRWLSIAQVGVPVVSLGNLTTGGTGKTPTAAWLANWLTAEGFRPGLLSRGYRSISAEGSAEMSQVAEPGTEPGNDEKRVLDRLCPGVPHLQQRDRVGAGRRLVSEFGCDVLILDDGFQHRRLYRDLDLVLIDALQPWGFGHLLPRGLLRELRSGLRRASLILLTRADLCSDAAKVEVKSVLRDVRGTDDCVEIAFTPQRLVGLDGRVEPLTSITGSRALAFCGIGNPDGFRQTLAALGTRCDLRVYPDHHHYQPADFRDLASAAQTQSADVALTTLKDLVKISPGDWSGPPLFAVEIGVEFLAGEELLTRRLREGVGKQSGRSEEQ